MRRYDLTNKKTKTSRMHVPVVVPQRDRDLFQDDRVFGICNYIGGEVLIAIMAMVKLVNTSDIVMVMTTAMMVM